MYRLSKETSVENIKLWRRIMGYMQPYRSMAAIAFAGILASIGLAIAIPEILGTSD